jgi:hypothetical protein
MKAMAVVPGTPREIMATPQTMQEIRVGQAFA